MDRQTSFEVASPDGGWGPVQQLEKSGPLDNKIMTLLASVDIHCIYV